MLDLLSGSLVARRLRLVASWLVARSFRGGELVGGEIPWWRGDRIPLIALIGDNVFISLIYHNVSSNFGLAGLDQVRRLNQLSGYIQGYIN